MARRCGAAETSVSVLFFCHQAVISLYPSNYQISIIGVLNRGNIPHLHLRRQVWSAFLVWTAYRTSTILRAVAPRALVKRQIYMPLAASCRASSRLSH